MTPALIPPVQHLKPHVIPIGYSGEPGIPSYLPYLYTPLSLPLRANTVPRAMARSVHLDAEMQSLLAYVESMRGLQENWDGYGAEGISLKVVTCTKFIVSLVNRLQYQALPLPEISPETNGTISLTWESGKGEAYLEIGETRAAGYIRSAADEKQSLIDYRMSDDSTPVFCFFEDILRQLYSPNNAVSPFASEHLAG
jgi:hypothetical protein